MEKLKVKHVYLDKNEIKIDNFVNTFDAIVLNYKKEKNNKIDFLNKMINFKIKEQIKEFKNNILKQYYSQKLIITDEKIDYEKEFEKGSPYNRFTIDFLNENRDIYNPLSNIKLFTKWEDLEIKLIAANIFLLKNRDYYIKECLVNFDEKTRRKITKNKLDGEESIKFLFLIIKYVLYKEFIENPIIKRINSSFLLSVYNNNYGYVDISFNKILKFLKFMIFKIENKKRKIIDLFNFNKINKEIEKIQRDNTKYDNMFFYEKIEIDENLKEELLKEKYIDFIKSLINQFETISGYFNEEKSNIEFKNKNGTEVYLIENSNKEKQGLKEVFKLFASIIPTQIAINQMATLNQKNLYSFIIILDDSSYFTLNKEKNKIIEKIIKEADDYQLKLVILDNKEEIKFYNQLK